MNPGTNGEHWAYKETRLRLLGRCYTFKYTRPVKKLDLQAARLSFYHNSSIVFTLHEPEQEFWFSEGLTPASIKFHKFDPKTGNLSAADVHIIKKVITIMGSNRNPCQSYETVVDFTICAKDQAMVFAKSNLTCLMPYTRQYLGDNSTLPSCPDEASSGNSRRRMTNMLLDLGTAPEKYGCVRPCREINYEASVSLYPKSTWTFNPNVGPGLYFSYYSLDVENKEERLLYDFPNLVSAIGGSMGLFLGLSLLEIFRRMIQHCTIKKSRTFFA